MTAFRRTGRRVLTVRVEDRARGRWVQRTTGTPHAATARKMQQMLAELRERRAWDVYDRVLTVSVPTVYDLWTAGGRSLEGLRAALDDTDLQPLVAAWHKAVTRDLSEQAGQTYEQYVRRLIPSGDPFRRSAYTRAAVQQALDGMATRPGTVRRAAAGFRSFTRWLVSRGVLSEDVTRDLRLPPPARPRVNYLDTPDAIRLAEAQPSPYRELSALLAGTGIEVSVALALRARDVDADRREVRAKGTKTHVRDRIVRVAEWAWPYVERATKGKHPDGRLFPDVPDRFEARKAHVAAVAALENEFPVVHGYTMRDARHSFAVRKIRAGTPAEVVAREMGLVNAVLVLKVYGRFAPTREERDHWERIAAARDAAQATPSEGTQ